MKRVLALLLMCCCAGCNIAGVLGYKLSGPPAVQAKFVPAKVPTLVLVENFAHESGTRAEAEVFERFLHEDLFASDVAPLVPLEKVQALREARSDYATMSVAAIGRAAEAQQVIYVQIKDVEVKPAVSGNGFEGKASAAVKLIDAAGGKTIWPADLADGEYVTTTTPAGWNASGQPVDVRQGMYRDLALQIDRLFHKWTPPDHNAGE